jgi:hypothetical protein
MVRVENLPEDFLLQQTSVEELTEESQMLTNDLRDGFHKDLHSLTAEMCAGDELWRWSSSSQSWDRHCGSAGLAIVRSGRIVVAIQLIWN